MNVNLPSDVIDFVKGLVVQGRFDTEEAAVVEGIRLLMSRENLRSVINKGIDQLDNGLFFEHDTVWAEVNAEIDKIESTQHGS